MKRLYLLLWSLLLVFILFVPKYQVVGVTSPSSSATNEKEQNSKKLNDNNNNVVSLSKQIEDEKVIRTLIKNLANIASNGLKNGLDASMRSLFEKPSTGLVAAVSVLIGAVTMLAFYESPVSPLPVPPLPDPPVGRFPPEHPIWPPPGKGAGGGGNYRRPYQQKRISNGIPVYLPQRNNQLVGNFVYPVYHRSDNGKPMIDNKLSKKASNNIHQMMMNNQVQNNPFRLPYYPNQWKNYNYPVPQPNQSEINAKIMNNYYNQMVAAVESSSLKRMSTGTNPTMGTGTSNNRTTNL